MAVDHSSAEEEAASSERVEDLIKRFQRMHPTPAGIGAAPSHTGQNGDGGGGARAGKGVQRRPWKLGFVEMFKLLFSRAWKQVRNRSMMPNCRIHRLSVAALCGTGLIVCNTIATALPAFCCYR